MSDLRASLRALRAAPVVTVAVVLSLALAIGANTALFSILDSLLLRPLPVERPDRLAVLVSQPRCFTQGYSGCSHWNYPLFDEIRRRRPAPFAAVFAYRNARFNLASGGPTDLVEGLWASGELFDALGVRPALGRAFAREDDGRGGGPGGPVAVVSHVFWQRRFGGTPDVLGQVLTIERLPFTVVGVMPPGFAGPEVGAAFDVAVPLGVEPLLRGRESTLHRTSSWWLKVMARLEDGETLASAEQALRALQPQLREATLPSGAASESAARYLTEPVAVRAGAQGTSSLRARYRRPIFTLLAAAALVLVIACVNIANLLLARAAAREHEFGVRRALGASGGRLARSLLLESLLLSGAGALIGLLFARWGGDLLLRQLSTYSSTVHLDLALDLRALAFTAAVATLAALAFGVVPAWRAAAALPMDALRKRGRGAVGERSPLFGGMLVATQLALSLVLVVGALLFSRTLGSLATRDLGFDRDSLLVAQMDVKASVRDPAGRAALYERVREAVRAHPGVSQAAVSDVTPVSGSVLDVEVEIEGGPRLAPPRNVAYINALTPGWFATYGTRLLSGRDFELGDSQAAPPVAIVNEAFVRRFLPGRSPLGRRIRNAQPSAREHGAWMEVVGVAADAAYVSLREPPPPTLYLPLAQQPEAGPSMSLSVRAAGGTPARLAPGVAEAVASVDRTIALTARPLREQVEAALVQERILAGLSAFLGALALVLAGLGLYGVTSYTVGRRGAEFGVRMALGASGRDIAVTVVRRVALVLGVGLVAGGLLAELASREVESLLFGFAPRDGSTLAAACLVMAAVAAAAATPPARRAAHLDPAWLLREQ